MLIFQLRLAVLNNNIIEIGGKGDSDGIIIVKDGGKYTAG
jgi:hypothetical protein